jgi:pimeloyl-ACP methyl ester carboxylesterase
MKRRLLGLFITIIVVMCMPLGTASAYKPEFKEWNQAINSVVNEEGLDFGSVSLDQASLIASPDRRHLVDDIYEYTLVLKVGPGEFDTIGIHRVVRERWPYCPIKSSRAIMMLHGDNSDFRSAFLMSTQSNEVPIEHSLAIYLAQSDIDVWGIDLRWTFVPDYYPGTDETPYCYVNGCTFMENWDTALHLKDIRNAVRIARTVRGLTGSGFGKMFMLGHSRGAQFTYAYANEETQLPWWRQSLRGIIPVDMVYKFDPEEEEGLIGAACTRLDALEELRDFEIYYSDEAVNLKGIAYLAATDPEDNSKIPGLEYLTNQQVAWLALSATYATSPLPPPVPLYHYCAGTFDESGPTGLQFTNSDYMLDFAFAVPSFQSLGEIIDGEAIMCSDSTSYDDYLDLIETPVFYVGAAGGFGAYGEYVLELLGSTDKQSLIVQLYPPEGVALDYGHIDLLFADNARREVWKPIFKWIKRH